MVKSPIKVIESGNVPTTENLGKGQVAFGQVGDSVKFYGSDGTTVSELQAGTQVNNLAPLVVDRVPTAGDTDSVAIGPEASAGAGGYVAIGDHAQATGPASGAYGSVAVGQSTSADARGVAIGLGSTSDSFAVAIGYIADTGGNTQSVVIGHRSTAAASCYHPTAVGANIGINDSNATAIGHLASIGVGGENSVSLGSYSSTAEPNVVSIGSGDATMALTDDMDEETKARIQARAAAATRRIVNVTDPTGAQDAATKNYVDTKISEIPTGTEVNQWTNTTAGIVKGSTVAGQIFAEANGTGSVNGWDDHESRIVNNTTNISGLQTKVDTLTTTVNSKANQSDLTSLQETVASQAETISQLQATITQLQSTIDNLVLKTEEIL